MGKYLKKYNKETQEWELVSAPDVSVEQYLPDGSKITDTNVVVLNEYYSGETSGDATLDEVLGTIGDDMRRLERNVSWLAEHGIGEGGGGGGTISSFGIEVISPIVDNGKAYVSGKTFEIEFMITGGSEGDYCTYSYSYDGGRIKGDSLSTQVNKSIKISVDNTESISKQFSMVIRATNPYGVTIPTKTFNIYESTLTLVFDIEKAGKDYENGVFKVRQNNPNAFVPFILSNGLMNSHTVLQATYATNINTIEFTNLTTEPQKIQMLLWDILKGDIKLNTYYLINFKAIATISSIGTTVESDTVPVRIRIISPDQMTISMGINGVSSVETTVALSSMMNYNFRVYGPTSVTSAYYAAKVVKGSDEYLILGQYYDENLHTEDALSYTANTMTYTETTISSQYYLSPLFFSVDDTISLYIKAWNINGTMSVEEHMDVLITELSNKIYPRQYSTRGGQGYTGHTMFCTFNAQNALPTSKYIWDSDIDGYSFLDPDLARTENSAVTLNISVQNRNDASGIISEEMNLPHLRLQNRAYAICDMAKYAGELLQLTHGGNTDGFTISVCVESDEPSDNQHTLFLWGTNSPNNDVKGIRIDINRAQWRVGDYIISCPISHGSRNMIDFSYVKTGKDEGTIRIYLNGVLNAAKNVNKRDFGDGQYFPNVAYIGASLRNGVIERFSDFNLYELSIYSKSLNDLQLTVNGKNARYTTESDYDLWKTKNFFDKQSSVPISAFFNNGEYITNFTDAAIINISQQSNIPTMYLFFDSDSGGFTQDFFYQKYNTDVTSQKFRAKMSYYDPSTSTWINDASVEITLQGTTTLGYRVKNLELYITEITIIDGEERVKLFQPKKEWFPESQFTLKADVVDSAHANNAVLGEWINNCGLMNPNPVMQKFNDSTRPKDVDDSGNIHTHFKPGTTTEVDCDDDVTIKHTLEGFPFLLFIHFEDISSYNFIGIYSFNLGRYSYYNMGMKFLYSFSRRGADNEKVPCPKLINYYQEMDSLGGISESDVYSFEFGNNGNHNVIEHPLWSQYDKLVVQSYGEFKYPSVSPSSTIWDKLCTLFEGVATFNISNYYNDSVTIFQNKYHWTLDANGKYVQVGTDYIIQSSAANEKITDHVDTHNTAAYFIIANAFGMTDSLGKNMTLRTWDGGETWWPAFYDMDSALALENDGTQNDAVDIAIDRVTMTSEGGVNNLVTDYHYEYSRYAAYLAKLWGIYRDSTFLYNEYGEKRTPIYETMWQDLRKTGGKLAKSTNFTDIMAARIETCGEMIYNYDYNMKYIQDAVDGGSSQTKAAITFLHGTRVEFVKDWLRRHLYYLDGIFDANRLEQSATYEDSPYNAVITNIGVSYPNTISTLAYTVQVSTPTFLAMTIGNDKLKKYYVDTANKDTILYYANQSSASAQLNLKGSNLITKFDGLQTGFRQMMGNNANGVFSALTVFDVSNSTALNNDPFTNSAFISSNGNSSLETFNLSNTRGTSVLETYDVNLENFNKVLSIDISNSHVTSLRLPQSSLQYLNITNSNLRSFNMENQNILTNVSFEGCDKLTSVRIVGCEALTDITIADKPNLGTITILNCSSISSVTISGCTALTNVEIGNNLGLKHIFISNCGNENLDINIYGSTLEEIVITNISSKNVIKLPSRELLTGVTTLNLLYDFYISGIKYGNDEIEYYNDEPVFDISPLKSLNENNLNLSYITTLKYLRVQNNEDSPFKIFSKSINRCDNLTRIFGHIEISDETSFGSFENFFINESGDTYPTWSNERLPFIDDPFYTNITITASDLSNCFSRTACNILDVYNVFRTINTAVTNIYNMFSRCNNIVTDLNHSLPDNLLINCTNVTDINGLFSYCNNIKTIIGENFLLPVAGNITTFNNVFLNCNVCIFTEDGTHGTIFPVSNRIVSIIGFNPSYVGKPSGVYENYKINSDAILANLNNLESLRNSYNKIYIDFNENGILKYNTSLVEIYESFRNISTYGDDHVIKNILGKVDTEHYPHALVSVVESFNFSAEDSTLSIGNSFFGNSNSTIEDITNSFIGIQKVIDFDDCDGLAFPYKVFRGCAKLKSVAGFFEGLDCISGDTVNTITLPSYIDEHERIDILGDCTSVTDASRLFANMKNVKYSLVGNGFKNCNLQNVSYMFNGRYGDCLIGAIPLKLFYEEDENGFVKKTIKNMSNLFYYCGSSALTYYDSNTISDEDLYEKNPNYVEGSIEEETKYPFIWNEYAYDGTADIDGEGESNFHRRVINSEIYGSGKISTTLPSQFMPGYSNSGKTYTQISSADIGRKGDGEEYTEAEKRNIFAQRNYFCPPDIFKYCVNDVSTNVDNAFAYTSNSYTDGLHGTIPPYLFEPISEIGSLNGVFRGCMLLLPYSWGYEDTDPETGERFTQYGNCLPDDLFSCLSNVYSISSMFRDSKVWGRTKFNLSLIPNTVMNLSSLFNSCNWIGDAKLEGNLISLTSLVNVNEMFMSTGPEIIPSGILSYIYNGNISSCAGFMKLNTRTATGILPDFWNYNLLKNGTRENVVAAYYEINNNMKSQIPQDANYWFTHN